MGNYKEFFKGKKITVMGLGLLGRSLKDVKFLAECGADLIVTDLKTEKELISSVADLKKYKKSDKNQIGIKFVLGRHRLVDFRNRDMILKSAGVPLDSIYIKEAKKNNIPIEMDVSLFAKYAPNVILIGVTGTRGKSITTAIIYEILSHFAKTTQGRKKIKNVFLGGNLRGIATLPLLKKVNTSINDRKNILVCELDSWQLQGFGENKISPHISVFTSFMPDHMNYYDHSMKKYFADKENIFKYQKDNDVLVIRPDVKKFIPKNSKRKPIIVNAKDVKDYLFVIPGKHNKENLACAVKVAEQFSVPINVIKKSIKNFKGLEGRLQYLKTLKGIQIYNDNNATTPEATIAGIEALKNKQGIILISGGADKGLDLEDFVKTINKYCKTLITIPGTGTNKLLQKKVRIENYKTKSLKKAIQNALNIASKGDIILFSPAFASFGMFRNEYERNDLFVKLIKKLK